MDQGFNLADGGHNAGSHTPADREVHLVRAGGLRDRGTGTNTPDLYVPEYHLLLSSPGLILAEKWPSPQASLSRWLRKQFYSVDRNREDR